MFGRIRRAPADAARVRSRLTAAVVVTILLAASLIIGPQLTSAQALSGSDFMPGLIISDSQFYDGSAMSEAQIQAFLASKGSGLAGYTFTVGSRDAVYAKDGVHLRCNAFQGGTLIPASTIIYRAQVACGVSAKVLLVTLQKEQGLITSRTPTQAAMDRAMGYACPDTAPCAPTTLGFGNQMYSGALQLVTYRANGFAKQPGWQYIQYSPNAACGSAYIDVQNYATAALYSYTPYQPDAAALANISGTGDSCSSYGNRNFWVYYTSWFGSTLGPAPYAVASPSIIGNTTAESTLSSQPGNWANSPTFSYSWLTCNSAPGDMTNSVPSDCTAIPGATTARYVTTAADIGHYMALLVTATNSFGSLTMGSGMQAPMGSPADIVAPSASGSTTVGSTFTLNSGSWTGTPSPTITIFWLRCSQPVPVQYTTVPAGCAAIAGANSVTYVSTSADLGSYLTAQIAGTNTLGFTLAGTVSTVAVGFPANSAAPTISGSSAVGSTLTLNSGTWTGTPSPTIAIYWLRCSQPIAAVFTTVPAGCAAISGANSSTYVSVQADVGSYLTAQVAGTNAMGFALAGAVRTTPVQMVVPANTVAPTVTGSTSIGSTWTVNPGTWTGAPPPTIAIYWLRCNQPITSGFTSVPAGCTAISGANGTTYVAGADDAGKYLTAQLAGNSVAGFALAGAVSTTAIQTVASAAPVNTVAPTVSGSAPVGSTWTVNTGSWTGSPAPTIAIYWLRCNLPVNSEFTSVPAGCTAINGANTSTYVSAAADVGKYLTAQVAGNSPVGFALAGAASTTAIQGTAPANVVVPSVSGSATAGSTWTVNTGTWTGSPTIVIYWLRCNQPVTAGYTTVPTGCTAINGANSTTYVSGAADVGKYLTAQVAGNSSAGFALAGAISTVPIQVAAPTNTSAPTVTGSATAGSTWTVNTGTWTGSPTIVIYWLRCNQPVTAGYTTVPTGCTAINGANSTTYVSGAADVGKYLTAQVAGNSSAGFALAGAISTVPIQVAAPTNTSAPTVTGSATAGSTWTVNTGTWTGSPTIVIYWLRCNQPVTAGYTTVPTGCTAINGANSTTYVSGAADVGKYLTAQVAGNSSAGFALAGAISTVPIAG